MRRRTLSVIVALLMLGIDEPQLAHGLRVVVVVHNRAQLPSYLVSKAQEVVSRIYATSGIDLVWFAASRAPTAIPADDVRIRIIILSKDAAHSKPYAPDALGFTPGTEGRHGRLAYILGHRVMDVSRGYHIQPAIVLAGAIAHEIGHMFLSGGHRLTGLMRPQFNQSDFRRIATGELQVTSVEAAEMRNSFSRFAVDRRASAEAAKR